jgi:hypothetical protein
MVRGESVKSSFRRSSAAIRSSPHVRLCIAISTMSRCTSVGMRGRPRGRDFRHQKRRKDLGATVRAYRDARSSAARAFDKLREEDECDPRCVVCAARSDPAFDVTRKLLPEEEVLRRQLRSGPDHQPQHAQQVSEEGERRWEHVWR